YATRDGWILIACGSNQEWRSLETALTLPSGTLPEYSLARQECIDTSVSAGLLQSAFGLLTAHDAAQRLADAGVPHCIPEPFWSNDATVDPLLRKMRVIVEEQHPEEGTVHEVGHTVRFA